MTSSFVMGMGNKKSRSYHNIKAVKIFGSNMYTYQRTIKDKEMLF